MSRHAHTASHFSGGFDSTGVALLASRFGTTPLHALSLVYESEPMLAQETEYVRAGLESDATIVPHLLPADGLLDYDGHDRLPILDEPSAISARWNTFDVLARIAADSGADTVMSGDGADHAPHASILRRHLLAAGRCGVAWRTGHSYTFSQSALRIMCVAAKQLVPPRCATASACSCEGAGALETSPTALCPWLITLVRDLRHRILSRMYPLSQRSSRRGPRYNSGDWLTGMQDVPRRLDSRPHRPAPRHWPCPAQPLQRSRGGWPVLAAALHMCCLKNREPRRKTSASS